MYNGLGTSTLHWKPFSVSSTTKASQGSSAQSPGPAGKRRAALERPLHSLAALYVGQQPHNLLPPRLSNPPWVAAKGFLIHLTASCEKQNGCSWTWGAQGGRRYSPSFLPTAVCGRNAPRSCSSLLSLFNISPCHRGSRVGTERCPRARQDRARMPHLHRSLRPPPPPAGGQAPAPGSSCRRARRSVSGWASGRPWRCGKRDSVSHSLLPHRNPKFPLQPPRCAKTSTLCRRYLGIVGDLSPPMAAAPQCIASRGLCAAQS